MPRQPAAALKGLSRQPQAGGPRLRATTGGEERLPLTGQRAGRQGSKERALTPRARMNPPGVPSGDGGTAKESSEEGRKPGKEWYLRGEKSAAPSCSLYGFFVKGQDNCQHQTFISLLNIVLS